MSMVLGFALFAAAQAAQAGQPVVQMTGPNGVTSTMPLELPAGDARLDQARDLIAKGQPAAALPLVDQVIAGYEKKYRSSSKTVYYSARSLEEGFVYSTLAGMTGRNGVVLNGDWTDAYFLKGFALIDLNRSDEAKALLERAVAMAPSNAQLLDELAEWHKNRREWDAAWALFQRADEASALSPEGRQTADKTRAIRGKAFILIERGKLDDAEKLYRDCLKIDPNDDRAKQGLQYVSGRRKAG